MAKTIKKTSAPKPAAPANAVALKIWQRKYFFEGLIFAFCCLLFANSIFNDYNLDDELVTINHRLTSKGISAIPEIFSSPYYQDESGYSYEYRPVVLASFAIEHQFFGDSPTVGHFFNLLLYALACVLLYKVCRSLFKNYSHVISLAITLLFAAHPSHTEIVCSIKNRDEILGLVFSLLAFGAVIKAVYKPNWVWIGLVPFYFMLALMSKNTMIPFILIVPFSMILLTEAGLGMILTTAVLFLIPTFFFLNLSSGYQKVLMICGVLSLVTGLYSLLNFSKVLAIAKTIPSEIYAQKDKIIAKSETNITGGDFSLRQMLYISVLFLIIGGLIDRLPILVLKIALAVVGFLGLIYSHKILKLTGNIKSKILSKIFVSSPDYVFNFINVLKDSFSISAILLTGSLAFVFCWGVYNLHFSAVIIIPVLLFLLHQFGEQKFSFWANVMLNISILFTLYSLHSSFGSTLPIDLISVYFICQLFLGKKEHFVIPFLSILGLYCLGLGDLHDIAIELYFVAFIMARYRRLSIFFILFLTGGAIFEEAFIHHFIGFTILRYTVPLLEISILTTVFSDKIRKNMIWLYSFVLLAALLGFRPNHEHNVQFSLKTINVVETTNKLNVSLAPTNQVRPLNYVENCVDANSPWPVRAGVSLVIIGHYLQKVIMPYPLSFYYGFQFIEPHKVTDTLPLVILAIYLLLGLLVIYFLKRDKMLSWGILVYLISITAVSNYLMPVAGMLADRFLLLPSLGWIIVFIFLLQKIAKLDTDTKPTWAAIKSPVKYVFTGLLLVYSVVTFARNMDWKDSLTLFRKDVKYVDNSSQAHNLLALRLMKISYEPSTPASDQLPMRQEAAQHFRRAIEIYPPFFNANFDLGRTYVILNQPDSAIVAFKKALLIDPNFTPAVITVGELYMQQNNLTEAEAYFKEAVRLKPTEYQSYNKLLGIYYFQKNYSAAISIAKLAVEKIPGQPEAYISLGRIYQDLKQNDSTRLWLNKALEVSPQNQEALRLLQAIGH